MKPKALICDLDGTLIASLLFRATTHFSSLRPLIGGILCRMPAQFQVHFFAKPTKYLEIAKGYQEDGATLFLVTARKECRHSRHKVKILLAALGLKIEDENIFMRPPDCGAIEHKRKSVARIAKKYSIVGILEDEERYYSMLKGFGTILNSHL